MILIVVVTVFLIALIFAVGFQVNSVLSGSGSSSLDFLVSNNRPHIIASMISYKMMDDRQFIEHAIEIVTTGNIYNAASPDIRTHMEDFLRSVDNRRFISISINKVYPDHEEEIISVDNAPRRCGGNREGFCSPKERTKIISTIHGDITTTVPGCNDGRIEIGFGINGCEPDEICCAEDVISGQRQSGISCGKISSPDNDIDPDDPGVCDSTATGCPSGRMEIDDVDNECQRSIYQLHTCCVPLSSTGLVDNGIGYRSEIPLLYKDEIFGKVRVTAV